MGDEFADAAKHCADALDALEDDELRATLQAAQVPCAKAADALVAAGWSELRALQAVVSVTIGAITERNDYTY